MAYINFRTINWHGCINLDTNDLYLSHTSPKYRRILSSKHVTYSPTDDTIDKEVHEAVANLAQHYSK